MSCHLDYTAVIPAFNRADLIRGCIESVQAQAPAPAEVIVVDDGSSDGTGDVAAALPGVRVIRQTNAGAGAARNTGVQQARTDWVAMVDSDDRWLPGKAAAQADLIRLRPDLIAVACGMEARTPDGRVTDRNWSRTYFSAQRRMRSAVREAEIVRLTPPPGTPAPEPIEALLGDFSLALFWGNIFPAPSLMIRRDIFERAGGYPASFRQGGEDYHFNSLLSRLGRIGYIDAPLVSCAVGRADHLGHHPGMPAANLATLAHLLSDEDFRRQIPEADVRLRMGQSYRWAALEMFNQRQFVSARGFFRMAAQHRAIAGRDNVKRLVAHLPEPLAGLVTETLSKARPRGRNPAAAPRSRS